MRRLRLQPILVHASCTDFLQPLDAYVSSVYKRMLHQRYQVLQVHYTQAVLAVDVWVGALVITVQRVLEAGIGPVRSTAPASARSNATLARGPSIVSTFARHTTGMTASAFEKPRHGVYRPTCADKPV